MHALVIDDNIANGQVLEVLLAQLGWETTMITILTRIDDDLHALKPVDMVFLDLEFPNESGFDLLPYLREHDVTSSVPIIAYSVHISEVGEARHAGFDGFLGKPLDSRQFPRQLADILDGKPVWEV